MGLLIGLWFAGLVHSIRKGHVPVWYDLGSWRQCLQCLGGGGNARQRLVLPV